jgi:hypothetical protein
MHEAVEIAKLRLFLKLVSTVEPDYQKPNLGLEPLPDVDFNIRAGNTLLGYTSEKEIEDALGGQLDFDNDLEKIKEKCDIVARTFARYKELQLEYGKDYMDFFQAKAELKQRLEELNDQLNLLLHKQTTNMDYNLWLATHQPFHWLAEFYELVHERGGFDVIIGNPPYVEAKKLTYKVVNYLTLSCGNLYAYIVERGFNLISTNARTGMIIPHSSICTDRMASLIQLITKQQVWLSTYDIRPSKLFEGVDQRLLIYITNNEKSNRFFTTIYNRWMNDYREHLFQTLGYVGDVTSIVPNSIPKAGKGIEKGIYSKIKYQHKLSKYFKDMSPWLYYHNAPRYFVRAMSAPPYFWNEKDGQKISSQIKKISFGNRKLTYAVGSIFNSSLFYWWFILMSDCRHLNQREIEYFPFNLDSLSGRISQELNYLFIKINDDYKLHKVRKDAYYKATGRVEYDEYYPKLSKAIIDEIDTVLAQHYGFTPEELDYIINYDIKYRMGKELGEEEDDP